MKDGGEIGVSRSRQPPCRPAQSPSRTAGEEGGREKRDDWRRLVYHWRLVRSLVCNMGSNYYDPVSASLTDFLMLFYFLSLLQFQKRIPLKPQEGGG